MRIRPGQCSSSGAPDSNGLQYIPGPRSSPRTIVEWLLLSKLCCTILGTICAFAVEEACFLLWRDHSWNIRQTCRSLYATSNTTTASSTYTSRIQQRQVQNPFYLGSTRHPSRIINKETTVLVWSLDCIYFCVYNFVMGQFSPALFPFLFVLV